MYKTIIFICFFFFTSCCVMFKGLFPIQTEDNQRYKIKKIKNKEQFYIIYVERNDSIFKIINSINNNQCLDCTKISVGDDYYLNLKKVFPVDSLLGKPVAPNLNIAGFYTFNGKLVKTEQECHNVIYTVLNLKGLYLLNIEK